jgi:hypothetical protein
MTNIRRLINQLGAQEKLLSETEFLAPCVKNGSVKTAIDSIVYCLQPQPADFEGWGIFQPVDNNTAAVVDEPTLPQIAAYVHLLKPLRLRLVCSVRGQTWLAYPVNESDMQQKFAQAQPIVVHLVTEGSQFEPIIARSDGKGWWFDEVDRRSDPQITVKLNEFLRQLTPPEEINFAGMTPEMLTTYNLAWQRTAVYEQRKQARLAARGKGEATSRNIHHSPQRRLEKALKQGGGELETFRDRGDFWQVEWRTRDGMQHTSAIGKSDLTVISAGICLTGGDRHFDLQSLVGVMEQAELDW